MFDKLSIEHVGHAFLIGVVAGVIIVILDSYVVQPLEVKMAVQPLAA